jgi:hypothetical protein
MQKPAGMTGGPRLSAQLRATSIAGVDPVVAVPNDAGGPSSTTSSKDSRSIPSPNRDLRAATPSHPSPCASPHRHHGNRPRECLCRPLGHGNRVPFRIHIRFTVDTLKVQLVHQLRPFFFDHLAEIAGNFREIVSFKKLVQALKIFLHHDVVGDYCHAAHQDRAHRRPESETLKRQLPRRLLDRTARGTIPTKFLASRTCR